MSDDITKAKYRLFRGVAYGVYLSVTVAVCVLTTVSVVRSVGRMTPSRPSVVGRIKTLRECVEGAGALATALDLGRRELGDQLIAKQADVYWISFRVNWLAELKSLQVDCETVAAHSAPLKMAFQKLDKAMDLYSTHATQFSGEMGPTIDALKQALADAAR